MVMVVNFRLPTLLYPTAPTNSNPTRIWEWRDASILNSHAYAGTLENNEDICPTYLLLYIGRLSLSRCATLTEPSFFSRS